jgi:hypothetical protein
MTTISIQILKTTHASAPGKLADAEIHFSGGELDGLKLVGFAVWRNREGRGMDVTFPSRHFVTNGERRAFSLLRWRSDRSAQDRLAERVRAAYEEQATPRRNGEAARVEALAGSSNSCHV